MDIPRSIEATSRDLTNRIAPQLESVREGIETFGERASDFIRERPGQALLGALAFGFIVGRIISRLA
jgi:ElaB/YqjD/DUF883 family membrane-anchored ribosome-binding protein